jgi:radical SAM protein with 4Fe4S-binding SPASM domain
VAAALERLKRRALVEHIPLTVTFELTLRCNLRCVHCYNFDRAQPQPRLPVLGQARGPELSDDEIFRILDEIRDEGCLFLALSGGEALSHPRLVDFVAHAARGGMIPTVKTNGTMLDETTARALVEAGCGAVEISVYGATAETHDEFVKMPGAFERTLRGVRAARAAGLDGKLSFVLHRRNAGEVAHMIALAEELGVAYGVDPQLTARYDGTTSSLDERLDGAALEALYRGPLAALVPPPPSVDDIAAPSLQCACARSVCGITAHGEVYPCIGAPLSSGNLRERSFRAIWRESPQLQRIRGLRREDFAACAPCEHAAHCRRSSGVLLANTGEYTGPRRFGDDLTCVEAEILHRLHDEGRGGTSALGSLRRHSLDK